MSPDPLRASSVLQLSCLLGCLLIAACATHARPKPLALDQAIRDRTAQRVRVVRVYDQDERPIVRQAQATVTHYVEVQVAGVPDAGAYRMLPYDEFLVGQPPPERGTELTIAPADWVPQGPGGLMKWHAQER